MIVLKDIGKFEELPEIAMHIYHGNIPALHAAITAGWDIEEGIVLSKRTTLSPLDLALVFAEKGSCRAASRARGQSECPS